MKGRCINQSVHKAFVPLINPSTQTQSGGFLFHFYLFIYYSKIAQFPQQHVAAQISSRSIGRNINSIYINVAIGAKPQGFPYVVPNSPGANTWRWSDLSRCVARLIVSVCLPLPAPHTGVNVVVHEQDGGVSKNQFKHNG